MTCKMRLLIVCHNACCHTKTKNSTEYTLRSMQVCTHGRACRQLQDCIQMCNRKSRSIFPCWTAWWMRDLMFVVEKTRANLSAGIYGVSLAESKRSALISEALKHFLLVCLVSCWPISINQLALPVFVHPKVVFLSTSINKGKIFQRFKRGSVPLGRASGHSSRNRLDTGSSSAQFWMSKLAFHHLPSEIMGDEAERAESSSGKLHRLTVCTFWVCVCTQVAKCIYRCKKSELIFLGLFLALGFLSWTDWQNLK